MASSAVGRWILPGRRCFSRFPVLFCVLAHLLGGSLVSSLAQGFRTREPRELDYEILEPSVRAPALEERQEWIQARRVGSIHSPASLFGRRLSIQTIPGVEPLEVVAGTALVVDRRVAADLVVAEAPDAWEALRALEALLLDPRVLAASPVVIRTRSKTSAHAFEPNDPYFFRQWNLDNRNRVTGVSAGVDLNVREAWPVSRGAGVTVAVADDGVEMAHPDLLKSLDRSPHFNFFTREEDGSHRSVLHAHGTALAGLISATGNNKVGMSGIAPESRLASWVIWDPDDLMLPSEMMMEMFHYASNRVAVQNHSWANSDAKQVGPSVLEQIGISNAVHHGRNGLGVVIVHAAGNGRNNGLNSNDDGFGADPQVITSGAVRFDGRVASYSTPGANVLVAAPSGDFDSGTQSIFTTDRLGTVGYNNTAFTNDLGDYAFDGSGFSGTSASAPQISALAALVLSANPNLTYRDVQHLFVLSSRQTDLLDSDVRTNGAGMVISHSLGFGVPDAGELLRMARSWVNRPAQVSVERTMNEVIPIPDDSLRVVLTGNNVPTNLLSIPAGPGSGLHPDEPTLDLPLVDVGAATTRITQDLRGKAALIQRGVNTFAEKLRFAAEAGAAFAIIHNNRDVDRRALMDTDFEHIPGVMIGQRDGAALVALLASGQLVRARLATTPASYSVPVFDTLICEQVVATVDVDHSRRADLRITLVSPSGTRSILQRVNTDPAPGPVEWSYMSTQHFLEPSAGVWRLEVTDEALGRTGNLRFLKLKILGTPITDSDRDGLDDDFERRFFGDLAQGPADDPDRDGYNNAREQVMRTDPTRVGRAFLADYSLWNSGLARLSWPSLAGERFEILGGEDPAGPFQVLTNATGRFPETSVFLTRQPGGKQFLQIRRVAP